MKRSELVTRIEEYLLHTQHLNIPCSLGSDFNAAANELVALIEQAGMLPPGYMKPIEFFEGKQYPLIPGDFKNEEGIWCTPGIREWESEDEEK